MSHETLHDVHTATILKPKSAENGVESLFDIGFFAVRKLSQVTYFFDGSVQEI